MISTAPWLVTAAPSPKNVTSNSKRGRTKNGNRNVDIGLLVCTAVGDDTVPYDVPPVTWGDSTGVGVGDGS